MIIIEVYIWVLITFNSGEPKVERTFGSFYACANVRRSYDTDPHTYRQCIKAVKRLYVKVGQK